MRKCELCGRVMSKKAEDYEYTKRIRTSSGMTKRIFKVCRNCALMLQITEPRTECERALYNGRILTVVDVCYETGNGN